ncbi:HNH endonuclease [Aeromicrobium sp.]|uniref:HNH endonuclease n=1 Tax=Aeromicrobium sp. TaxID=1871063 RepID=UPI00261EC944|nr:HNH endonuclease [Aeromicrobium sp.]
MSLPGMPKPPTGDPVDVRPELLWDSVALREYPWLTEIVDNVAEDASPPLYMSRPPADAVDSYGSAACEWIEAEQGITLRWWQRLAITRQLEHRADGTLCCETFVETAPRRAGKSVRMRGTTLWRMADPLGLFRVEPQLVMHTGSDMAICREIQRGAWRWAEARGWEVTRANGKESVESVDGDRWLVRSQDGVYGYDVTVGLVDEAWDVKPDTLTEGLEPATLERHMPQIGITSTAHRRATSLMRGKISTALAVDDPSVVLLVWAAPAGADPGDPEVWRAASPHWSEHRRRLIASKYEAALAGQADPQADDPDPLAGFSSQYLNIWRLSERTVAAGDPVTDPESWGTLTAEVPDGPPVTAAIESWFAAGVSLGVAWRVGARVVVRVTDHASVAAARDALAATGYRGKVTVGSSLTADPALARVRVEPGEKPVGESVTALKGLLREGVLAHDGGAHLTGQTLALRTKAAPSGITVISRERADAVKVAVWAATAARTARTKRMAFVTGT